MFEDALKHNRRTRCRGERWNRTPYKHNVISLSGKKDGRFFLVRLIRCIAGAGYGFLFCWDEDPVSRACVDADMLVVLRPETAITTFFGKSWGRSGDVAVDTPLSSTISLRLAAGLRLRVAVVRGRMIASVQPPRQNGERAALSLLPPAGMYLPCLCARAARESARARPLPPLVPHDCFCRNLAVHSSRRWTASGAGKSRAAARGQGGALCSPDLVSQSPRQPPSENDKWCLASSEAGALACCGAQTVCSN